MRCNSEVRTNFFTEHSGTPAVVPSSVFVSDFACLDVKPSFGANISGIVSSVGAVTESQEGVPMRLFRLHDHGGRYVACQAFGRHAENEAISDGNEVICFFVMARAGLASGDGQLWLFDDCHVVCVRVECVVPPGRTLLSLRI